MLEFEKKTKLRQVTNAYLATRLNHDEIQEQTKIFQDMDTNKDGYLTFNEIKKGLKGKMPDEEIMSLMATCDTDLNGAINYSEFLQATLSKTIY